MFKIQMLMETKVTLKGSLPAKDISADCELTQAEGEAYSEDLIKFQQAKILAITMAPQAPKEPEVELTPEQKADRIEAIRTELDALKVETENASPERKEEIKAKARELKAEAKKLKE